MVFPGGGGPDVLGEGRWMACSPGWDWYDKYWNRKIINYYFCRAPKSQNPPVLSKGIYKSVYIVKVNSAAITAVVPAVTYTGDYPTSPLVDGEAEPFLINISEYIPVFFIFLTLVTGIYFSAPASVTGVLYVVGNWEGTSSSTRDVTLPEGDSIHNVTLQASTTLLWWPAGTSQSQLININ